jgi:hypothetical protein
MTMLALKAEQQASGTERPERRGGEDVLGYSST